MQTVSSHEIRNWVVAGIIATAVIVLAIPVYYLKVERNRTMSIGTETQAPATFIGSNRCMDCHKQEYDKWLDSHHDHAMDVANESTVLGDFNDANFEIHGVKSRFYRKAGGFFVYTQGPEGKMREFKITHTFGWYPLQQYLIPFPDGRLQCLPIAWDAREEKWYHLYPSEPLDPKDWLYWTNAGQNWNGMCAECHSTNLKKNYDSKTDTYQTTWSEIDVSCEACHGPGSRHVEWAEIPEMARSQTQNHALVVKTSGISSRKHVELCAPCHSLRAPVGDYNHQEHDLLDSNAPSLLTEQMYFSDGQIMEEVYVYGSFIQSKMYHHGVRCNDCHDVHSAKLVKEGNALCLQCHRASEYDTKKHHFHKKKGEKGDPIVAANDKVLFDVGTGAECVQCHMPGRYYMGVDYRPDHGFRIPRPDLSVTIGTPNACNRCHTDKTARWSDETVTQWYGPSRRNHYGTLIDAGRKGQPEVHNDLIQLTKDPLYPAIVRATTLSLLAAYPGEDSLQALALVDDEPLIRRTAVQTIQLPNNKRIAELLTPLLYDPVKAVRIEAASRLAGAPSKNLNPDQKKVYRSILKEFETSLEYTADFAFGRHNLGNLYVALDRPKEAIRNYMAAIKIDDLFYPAKVNLAMLYNQRQENNKAEELLREVITANPEMHEIAYSLGLLLAEMKKYDQALIYLEKAAKGMPERADIHYNLGLLLEYLAQEAAAEAALIKAVELGPDSMDYLYSLANHYLKRRQPQKAKFMVERMVALHPNHHMGHKLLEVIEREGLKQPR